MAGYQPGSPSIDNLQEPLRSIALRIVTESGGKVSIGSGWRSVEHQSRLYNAWKNGTYNVPAVARPGRSKHNHGLAVDFSGDLQLAQQLGRKYGLVFPVKGEAWHGELGGNVDAQSGGGDPTQYNINYVNGQPEKPEDVLANRMQAITQIISRPGGTVSPLTTTNTLEPVSAGFSSISPGPVSPSSVGAGGGPADPQGFGNYARSLFKQFGFNQQDFPALIALWNKESGDPEAGTRRVTWSNTAQNPSSTAFGIAQFLNGTWEGTGVKKTTNPQQQIMAGLTYIKSRYQNPRNALQFHLRNNWY